MKKIARRNFLKLVGVSASIPILQSLPIASASATDLSDYPLLKDGIFDFENTDITQYVDDVQEVFGSEKDMIEEMLSSGELTPQDLKQHLLELAEQPSSVLVERGFSESQIAIIEEYDGIEDAFDYLYAPNERTGIARSSATVKFLYGLAGSGSRQKVTIAYDIKWSERPIYVGIDSFGIGWIAADSSSHQLATKTASAVGEVSYCYASTGNSAGLSSSVDMDTSQSGGVVGTPVIINHQNTSTYGKHISGTVGVGTQSNSSNIQSNRIKSYSRLALSSTCFSIFSRFMLFTRATSSPASSMFAGIRSTPSAWCRMPSPGWMGWSFMAFCIRVERVVGSSSGCCQPMLMVSDPCGSVSTNRTFLPSIASPMPRFSQVVLFPTPPF